MNTIHNKVSTAHILLSRFPQSWKIRDKLFYSVTFTCSTMSKHIVLLLIAIFVVTVTSAHDVESDFLKKVMPAKPVRDRFRNDPYGEKKRVFDTVGIFPRAEACATKFNVEFKLSHLVVSRYLPSKCSICQV